MTPPPHPTRPHPVSGDRLFSEPETLNPDPPDLAQMAVALLRGPPTLPRGGCGHKRQPWAVGVMVFVVASSEGFSCPRLLRGAIPRSPSRPLPTSVLQPDHACCRECCPLQTRLKVPSPRQASLSLIRKACLPPWEPTAVTPWWLWLPWVCLLTTWLSSLLHGTPSSAWHPVAAHAHTP